MKKPLLEEAEDPRELKPELGAVLRRVGKRDYARVTASEFAPGGKYNQRKKPRTALT